MLTWSERLARVIPWIFAEDADIRRIRDEAATISAEAEDLAPLIDRQTAYLVRKGQINGFTSQLQRGFQRKTDGE